MESCRRLSASSARINPVVQFELTDSGLAFENPAVKAGLAEAPKQGYPATWYRFNNGTGAVDQIRSPTTARDACCQQPLCEGIDPRRRTTARAVGHAVDVYFRRAGNAWQLVGVERLVEPVRK